MPAWLTIIQKIIFSVDCNSSFLEVSSIARNPEIISGMLFLLNENISIEK